MLMPNTNPILVDETLGQSPRGQKPAGLVSSRALGRAHRLALAGELGPFNRPENLEKAGLGTALFDVKSRGYNYTGPSIHASA